MEIKNFNSTEIKELLESGDFDGFIGSIENDLFEAKPSSVFIEVEGNLINFKLSKYVASFANGEGGYVLCGLKTDRLAGTPQDVVVELDLQAAEKFLKPIEIIARSNKCVYPNVSLQICWYPYKNDSNLGLFTIYVPKQDEGKKYFYIKTQESKKELFGVPTRRDGHTYWSTVSELYARTKLRPNTMQEAFDVIVSQLEGVKMLIKDTSNNGQRILDDQLTKKMEKLESEMLQINGE